MDSAYLFSCDISVDKLPLPQSTLMPKQSCQPQSYVRWFITFPSSAQIQIFPNQRGTMNYEFIIPHNVPNV